MGRGPASDAVSFEPPARERAWASVLAITALSAVVILAGFRVYHWWTHPTMLGGTYGNRLSVSTNPQTIWSFPLSRPHPGQADTLTFRDAPEQVWKANTAGVVLTVKICHVEGSGYLPGQIGFNNGPPGRYCSSLAPIRDGSTFRYPSPDEYLLAVVQATRPGVASLDTIIYNYKAGTHAWSPRGLDTQRFRLTFKVSHQPMSPCCVPE
jgi:hypothetical protein